MVTAKVVSTCSKSQHSLCRCDLENLTNSQWSKDEKAIKAEAEGLRANGTWDDSTVVPVTELCKRDRTKGEDIKIADVLTDQRPIQPTCFLHRSRNCYHSGNAGSVESQALVRMPHKGFLCRLHSSLSSVPP